MIAPDIDDALRRSNPWRPDDVAALAMATSDLASQTRPTGSRPRRRAIRRAVWVPVAALGGLALTAGTLIAVDDLLHADLPITIEYTTDTGQAVSCTATIEGGSYFAPREEQVVAYYRSRDFSGIGQRIYDYALVLAGDREAVAGVLPRSSEVTADDHGFAYPDQSAFSMSLTTFLLTDAVLDLGIQGSGDSWLQSDCTGQLH